MSYTVPAEDALSDRATYHWRVRAKDTGGSDEWGPWSEVRTFAVSLPIEEVVEEVWTPPEAEDVWYARLPFAEAQAKLGENAPKPFSKKPAPILATCGWHSLVRDEEVGSFAIVRTDGVLSGLVGSRIMVELGGRRVAAYVHKADDVMDDLSLTRQLFSRLGPLTEDYLDVRVWPL